MQLSSVDASVQRDFLLSYVDLPIYQAIKNAVNVSTTSYADVKKFLCGRYSTTDDYIACIDFFNAKFTSPADSYASLLNSYVDKFEPNLAKFKEQILVAKFISSAPQHYANELRLRRPTSLNSCVEICNALPSHGLGVNAVNSSRNFTHRGARNSTNATIKSVDRICFRCGSLSHVASSPTCPAKKAECRRCHKIGHFKAVCRSGSTSTKPTGTISSLTSNICSVSRPTITAQVNGFPISFIVDTGAEISVLSLRDCKRHKFGYNAMVHGSTFSNFDGSDIAMFGQTSTLRVIFNNKYSDVTFYVADVPHSILGIDSISGLRLNISFADSTSEHDVPIFSDNTACVTAVSCENRLAEIRLLPTAPDTIVQRVRRLPYALEEKVEAEFQVCGSKLVISRIEFVRAAVDSPIDNS